MTDGRRKFANHIFLVFALFFALIGQAYAVTPQSGWWWNPAEGGRGFTIEQQGNNIYLAGFLYDPSGRATWYAAGPAPIVNSTFTAPLMTYLGGQSLNGKFRPPTGTINNGTISITFSDASHGVVTWPGGKLAIQRFDIVPGGAAAIPPAGNPQAGWWWNSAEGGRGYVVEIQNGHMFLGAYMYDDAGNPVWYVSGPTPMTNPSTYNGVWQQYSNGQTMTGAYKSPVVSNPNVGNVKVTFSSATTGSLTLPNGTSIPLTRFAFSDTPVDSGGLSPESCDYNLALIALGNTYQTDMNVVAAGAGSASSTSKYKVNGLVNFLGQNAIEVQANAAVTSGMGAGTTSVVKSYNQVINATHYQYGTTTQTMVPNFGTVTANVSFTPPLHGPMVQSVNQPYSQSYVQKVETTSPLGTDITNTSLTQTITHLGVETVTVPAGTFKACKSKTDMTANGVTSTVYAWMVASGPYQGLFLKSDDMAGTTSVATKLMLNGQ